MTSKFLFSSPSLFLLFFSHLPVQCLCEFLLSSTVDKQHKQQQLITHLRSVLMDPNQDPSAPCEVLEYFLRRLHSMQSASRLQAIKVQGNPCNFPVIINPQLFTCNLRCFSYFLFLGTSTSHVTPSS